VNSENLTSGLRRIGPPLQWAGLALVQSRGKTEAGADRCCRSDQGSSRSNPEFDDRIDSADRAKYHGSAYLNPLIGRGNGEGDAA